MCWLGVSHIQPEYYFMLRSKIQGCVLRVVELLYALAAFAPQLRKCRNTLQSPRSVISLSSTLFVFQIIFYAMHYIMGGWA
jgi:hypothetical protein